MHCFGVSRPFFLSPAILFILFLFTLVRIFPLIVFRNIRKSSSSSPFELVKVWMGYKKKKEKYLPVEDNRLCVQLSHQFADELPWPFVCSPQDLLPRCVYFFPFNLITSSCLVTLPLLNTLRFYLFHLCERLLGII